MISYVNGLKLSCSLNFYMPDYFQANLCAVFVAVYKVNTQTYINLYARGDSRKTETVVVLLQDSFH